MKAVDHPRCGTLPDFGNFRIGPGEEYDRYKGVAELMPWAKGVSAKSNDFDAQGNEVAIDYGRMIEIVLDHGYKGYIGIEYEGERLSEAEGVAATKKLLQRTRSSARGFFGTDAARLLQGFRLIECPCAGRRPPRASRP
jgi:L-ribulose-5-phosphate 3-epimerase